MAGLPPVLVPQEDMTSQVHRFGEPQQTVVGSAPLTPEERWVQWQLAHFEDSYTRIGTSTYLFTTFNVGCRRPPTDVSTLVRNKLESVSNSRQLPDFIVVGLQEVDMSASAMIKEETEAATPWVTSLREAVGADHERSEETNPYYPLCNKQLVGLMMFMFVKKSLVPHVRDVNVTTIATGALGTVGNKGGVAIRYRFHMTSVCIINCHLAAGQEHLKKRNENIYQIIHELDFNLNNRELLLESDVALGGAAGATPPTTLVPVLSPKDHDLIFVLGDLNYRVDLPYEKAVGLAASGNYAPLLQKDQLINEMVNPHSPWRGFTEFTPNFAPTYRFDIGTDTYDTSEKKRIPAFTDRILYWARDRRHSAVELVTLRSVKEMMSSDHKPVQAQLNVPVRELVSEERQAVLDDLRRRVEKNGLDKVASAKTSVSANILEFAECSFTSPVESQTVTVKNEGECVAVVKVCRQTLGDISEGNWLRVFPLHCTILPGESCEVTIECVIDTFALGFSKNWAPFKGKAKYPLRSVLAICVEEGSTHILEASVSVMPSVFGNLLNNIVGLGNVSCREGYMQSKQLCPPDRNKPPLPKELWYLTDSLYHRGMRTKELFTEGGEQDECRGIMEFLDSTECEPIPENLGSITSVAQTYVTFLRTMQVPVIPTDLYHAALAAGRNGGKEPILFVQQQLHPLHANVLVYVMALLNAFLRPSNAVANELTPEILAELFAHVLFVRPAHRIGADSGAGPPSLSAGFRRPAATPSSSSAPPPANNTSITPGVGGGGGNTTVSPPTESPRGGVSPTNDESSPSNIVGSGPLPQPGSTVPSGTLPSTFHIPQDASSSVFTLDARATLQREREDAVAFLKALLQPQ